MATILVFSIILDENFEKIFFIYQLISSETGSSPVGVHMKLAMKETNALFHFKSNVLRCIEVKTRYFGVVSVLSKTCNKFTVLYKHYTRKLLT